MTLFLAAAQFREHARVDRRLRIHKTLEIERVGHGCLSSVWPTSSASRSSSGRWPSIILARAAERQNHSARSISGKVFVFPLLAGPSTSKVLLAWAARQG